MTGPAQKMDHAFVEGHDVLARYRANRLSATDADAFEIHYLDCAICRSTLEADDALAEGFRAKAGESVNAPLPRPAQPRRFVPFAIAATILVAANAAVWVWQASKPEITATQIVPILAQRQDSADATPIEVAISGTPELIVLVIDVPQPDLRRHDVSIVGPDESVIWNAQDVPTRVTLNADRLAVAVPSTRLAAGTYRLLVSGKREDGSAAGTTTFQLRVSKEP